MNPVRYEDYGLRMADHRAVAAEQDKRRESGRRSASAEGHLLAAAHPFALGRHPGAPGSTDTPLQPPLFSGQRDNAQAPYDDMDKTCGNLLDRTLHSELPGSTPI